jgi:hypothetical protein
MQWTDKTRPLVAMILACGLGGSAAGQASGDLSCIDHSARASLNSSQIVATNRCSKPVLANICARIDDRIGTITQGQRIEPGSSYTFDMVNTTKARMRYNIAHCEPGQTLRRDLCVPSCPAEISDKTTEKSSENKDNVGSQRCTQLADQVTRAKDEYHRIWRAGIDRSSLCDTMGISYQKMRVSSARFIQSLENYYGSCDPDSEILKTTVPKHKQQYQKLVDSERIRGEECSLIGHPFADHTHGDGSSVQMPR